MAVASDDTSHDGDRSPRRPGPGTPSISVLHATYHRPGGPTEVVDAWLGSADHPDRIEYVLAGDADDEAVAQLRDPRVVRVLNPADDDWSTAVRNWNAAAAASTGDLLVVVADDLFPPPGWDTALRELCRRMDPRSVPFAVKVQDSDVVGDALLRHPVVSRCFLETHGLFDPRFTGVYCDDDISLRALYRAIALDGRSLRWEHRHPTLAAGQDWTASHERINRAAEYERGRRVLRSLWGPWKRRTAMQLVPVHTVDSESWRRAARRSRRSAATRTLRRAPSALLIRARRTAARLLRRGAPPPGSAP